jgi:hypothetical protein
MFSFLCSVSDDDEVRIRGGDQKVSNMKGRRENVIGKKERGKKELKG